MTTKTKAELELWVPGPPRAKGRPRANSRGHVYTPEGTRKYEAMVGALCLKSHFRLEAWQPYRFRFTINVSDGRHGDPDNIIKTLFDGIMQGNPEWDDKLAEQGEWSLEHVPKAKEGVLVEAWRIER